MEVLAKRRHDTLRLVLPKEAVIDEDTGELVAHRPVDEERGDRRVDTAGEAAEHVLRADLRPDPLHLLVDHGSGGPDGAAPATR